MFCVVLSFFFFLGKEEGQPEHSACFHEVLSFTVLAEDPRDGEGQAGQQSTSPSRVPAPLSSCTLSMHRGSQAGNRHLGAKDTSQDAFKNTGSIFLASGILSCGQSHPTGLKWAERHPQERDLKHNLGFAKPSANCGAAQVQVHSLCASYLGNAGRSR